MTPEGLAHLRAQEERLSVLVEKLWLRGEQSVEDGLITLAQQHLRERQMPNRSTPRVDTAAVTRVRAQDVILSSLLARPLIFGEKATLDFVIQAQLPVPDCQREGKISPPSSRIRRLFLW